MIESLHPNLNEKQFIKFVADEIDEPNQPTKVYLNNCHKNWDNLTKAGQDDAYRWAYSKFSLMRNNR